jgi:hypothetical protein
MNAVSHKLSPDLMAEMAAIRLAVGKLPAARLFCNNREAGDLIDQGNRMVHCFENWLLDDEQKQALSSEPWDMFILYASSYLHDISLTNSDGPAAVKQGSAQHRETGSFIPAIYARSHEFIRANWQDLNISNQAMADIIARVCLLAGNYAGENPAAAESETAVMQGAPVNLPLLGACLGLCKALDLKSPVTLLQIYSQIPAESRLSLERMQTYFDVAEIGFHPYINGTIRLRIHCTHPEIHRALKHHERVVQHLLESLNQQVRPRFLYSDVIFEIEPDGYTPIDLKFSVDSSAGLQLFMGNRLYSDRRVFLRELVQNAVDACNYRKLADDTYAPAITIEFNEDVSTIKIRDNGIGMARQWLEKYFLAIGISFYQSNEIRSVNQDKRIDFGFISQFGIGFLSSFQVAEKIVIKTRKANHPGLMITISGLRDYFDVRELQKDLPLGTEVTLYLKKSKIKYCRSMEYVGYLKTNIRFLRVPVELKDRNGDILTIGSERLVYDSGYSAGTVFIAPLNFSQSEGYVRLGAINQGAGILALESANGGVSIFQDGIFVTQDSSLLPEGARQNVVARINLVGQDKCELSMDRNRIFWTTDQLQNIKKTIRHGMADAANQLMAEIQTQHAPVNTLNSIVNHLAIFFDFSDVDDAIYNQLCEPIRKIVAKRFRDFIRINFAHTRRSNPITEADGYNEHWQQQILESFVN